MDVENVAEKNTVHSPGSQNASLPRKPYLLTLVSLAMSTVRGFEWAPREQVLK